VRQIRCGFLKSCDEVAKGEIMQEIARSLRHSAFVIIRTR
jgi:hypothetical protein